MTQYKPRNKFVLVVQVKEVMFSRLDFMTCIASLGLCQAVIAINACADRSV